MSPFKVISLMFFCGVQALSCIRTPLKEAFDALDDAIARRESYVQAFERQNDSLRARIADGGGQF